MKNLIILAALMSATLTSFSQRHTNLGMGYFGETASYPGAIVQIELEHIETGQFSSVIRADLGFYNHKRSHNAFFLSVDKGFRKYTKSGKFYSEQLMGIGALQSFYNEELFHVDDRGGVVRVKGRGNTDFMPSLSFGFGYDFTDNDKWDYIWFRPKVFWQLPFNNITAGHVALQFGYSIQLK